MQCPKCGFEQATSEVCEACGIIFSKYEKRRKLTHDSQAETTTQVLPEQQEVTVSGRDNIVKTLIIVVLAVALGVMAGKLYFGQSSKTITPSHVVIQPKEQVTESMPDNSNDFGQPPNITAKNILPDETQSEILIPSNESSIQVARNATVLIETPWGSGSGFFVDGHGHIITNRHVVKFDQNKLKMFREQLEKLEDALEKEKKQIKVLKERLAKVTDNSLKKKYDKAIRAKEDHYEKYDRLYWKLQEQRRQIEYSDYPAALKIVTLDGREFTAYDVEYSDEYDLALITLKGISQPPIKPNFLRLNPGTRVYSIGNPSGLRHTVTAGIISGYRSYQDTGTVIQTDAPINPGNSGGPLIDDQGQVLGVNTMILDNTEGIGFAISIKDVWDEFSDVIAQ